MDTMRFGVNLGLAIFSEVILIFLILSTTHDSHGRTEEARQHKLFILLLAITFIEILADILSRLDSISPEFYSIYSIANMILFLTNPLIMAVWLLYVCEQLPMERKAKRTSEIIAFALCTINAAVSVVTPFCGLIYYFDSDKIYHRGPLYLITAFSMMTMALYTELLLIRYRKQIESRHFYAFILFLLLPVAASIIQIFLYGYAIALNATVLAELIVFVHIQNRNLDRDYLTGLYNRRKLDNYLRKRIRMADKSHSFAAILLDINNFKYINDQLGHLEGDDALINAANILKSVTRSGTMIARYGGDEFCIALDIEDRSSFDALLKRIKENTTAYKQIDDKILKLSFSMGGDIYDPASNMSLSEFQAHIDKLMYEDKQKIIHTKEFSGTISAENRRKSD